jgi:UDPglucose 6-dehydrogenase
LKVSVIGAGYVGLVTATCLSELGHQVICVESDQSRLDMLLSGGVPIYEPGLDTLISRNVKTKRLNFTGDMPAAVTHAEIIFIAVGTPPQEDGSADLAHVLAAARQIARSMAQPLVIVNKSTVPVGTAELVTQTVASELRACGKAGEPFVVVSNPEFLKEGAALDDFMHPDRIVVGIPRSPMGAHAKESMQRLYASLNRHHERMVWMDVPSAELTKYAANAMLATRISFMNEIANLADLVGADVDSVRRGIGSDSRIGPSFLYAGTGYGGSCFPKDTRALVQTANRHGRQMQVVEATERVNQEQRNVLVRRITQRLGEDLSGRLFAIWGLAFKPQTDDMREATSRYMIRELVRRGARVQAHDPVAMPAALLALAEDLADIANGIERVSMMNSPNEALTGADALVLLTEWKQFHNPDFAQIKQELRQALIFDGRNLYDPQQLQDLGIAYQGIGRGNALARNTGLH